MCVETRDTCLCILFVCVYACVRERERHTHTTVQGVKRYTGGTQLSYVCWVHTVNHKTVWLIEEPNIRLMKLRFQLLCVYVCSFCRRR